MLAGEPRLSGEMLTEIMRRFKTQVGHLSVQGLRYTLMPEALATEARSLCGQTKALDTRETSLRVPALSAAMAGGLKCPARRTSPSRVGWMLRLRMAELESCYSTRKMS